MKNKKECKRISRKERGITLIALVITIIVLLILAGVSIATLTGQNGILTQAKNAKERTEDSQVEEEIKLAYNTVQTDALINGWDINKKASELQKELQKEDPSATVTVDGTNLKISYKGYETTISSDGTIGDLTQSDITINVEVTGEEATVTADGTKIKEVKDGNVPIPANFYYVGGSKNTGVVISDNSEDENKGDSHEAASNLKGNQFVWVPIKVNQKIIINVNSKEDIASVEINGESQTVNGKTFTKTIEDAKVNRNYCVKVKDSRGNVKSYVKEISSLYASSITIQQVKEVVSTMGGYKYNTVEEAMEAEGVASLEELLSKAGVTSLLEYMGNNGIIKSELWQIEDMYIENNNSKETEDNSGSVKQYGGFYIARYEAGVAGTTSSTTNPDSNKTTIDGTVKPVSQKGVGVWNQIPYDNGTGNGVKKVAENMYQSSSVTSKLIDGTGWDRTLQWLIETGAKTEDEVMKDSTSWGNYSDDTFTNTTGLITTGQFNETKANNIYDLAGNVGEWTTEEEVERGRMYSRGGSFNNIKGWLKPAYYRFDNYNSNQLKEDVGFRVALYL